MIHYRKDIHNIVTLTLDMSSRNMNIINHQIWEAFVPVIEHLKQEKRKGLLRGVILTSEKSTFLAGGDLEYLYQATDPQEIYQISERMKRFLRELERPGVAVVAALNGSAIGAGFEVALACHHRIAVNDPAINLGLPEVEIGLIPGGGGIIRLMWLLGIEKAFQILTSGRRYSPGEALKAGIVDELAPNPKAMLEQAKQWLLNNTESRRPWDRPNCRIPGGSAKDLPTAQVIRKLTAQLCASTHNNYPAPQAILNVLSEGSKVDFDTAGRIESRYYTELVRSKQCKNMIKAFWFDANFIKYGLNRPKGYGKFRVKKVGIIGAGMMGSGIALACLRNGLEVVIKDVSKLIAERGREFIHQKITALFQAGAMEAAERQSLLARVHTTDMAQDFDSCDLVIEAVFENIRLKQKVTKESEAFLDDYAIFATNTLSIPITTLADASIRPENYVGLHFFHPADEVPLVEIVKGEQTSEETIARAFDFVKTLHKTPIVVKDIWGFYAARVQNTYILEGIAMLREGIPAALIENLGRQGGMPKGPLALADDLGLAMVLHYENQAASHYGTKYIQHPAVPVLETMLQEHQRGGRQKKAGFFNYPEEGERRLWSELTTLFPSHPQTNRSEWTEWTERLLFVQVLEAVWCMQEKVILSIPAANLGSIYGWGFPSFKGGVIQYIHDYGVAAFLDRCQTFEQKYGRRFKAPKHLKAVISEPNLANNLVSSW